MPTRSGWSVSTETLGRKTIAYGSGAQKDGTSVSLAAHPSNAADKSERLHPRYLLLECLQRRIAMLAKDGLIGTLSVGEGGIFLHSDVRPIYT